MLLSKLTKYLHLKSPKTSPREEKSPQEVTCVSNEEIRNSELEIRNVSSNETVDNCFLRSECAETRSNASEACPHEQNDYVSRENNQAKPQDTTSHLGGSVPRRVETPKGVMTKAEMREAREIFYDLDDAEIHRLYKKVTQ